MAASTVNSVYVNSSVELIRKRSRIPAMSKMEIFLTIGDGSKLLTLGTKSFILGIARVLDALLVLSYKAFENKP